MAVRGCSERQVGGECHEDGLPPKPAALHAHIPESSVSCQRAALCLERVASGSRGEWVFRALPFHAHQPKKARERRAGGWASGGAQSSRS